MTTTAITEITPEIKADIDKSVDKIMASRNIKRQGVYLLVCRQQNMLLRRQLEDLETTGMAHQEYKLTEDESARLAAGMPNMQWVTRGRLSLSLTEAFKENAELLLKVNALRNEHGLPTIKPYFSKSYK